jgi:hypothetical protein
MRYAALIYTSEAAATSMTEAEQAEEYNAYVAFQQFVDKTGALLGGDALLPTTSATTVRVRDGKTLTTDGPFAETKEQLGGFYLLNCENLDQAIEIAARIPGAAKGSIEVRPIMEFN